MALGVTDLKKGTIFVLDGTPYRVVNYAQKVMGRGGSIVNVRIKSLADGKVYDRTFKGSEQFEPASISNVEVQYLYKEGDKIYFMNGQTFEQFEVTDSLVGDQSKFLKEGASVSAQLYNGKIVNLELPKNVYLKVEYTEGAVRGDTSSAVTKDATLETGITVKVPAFIKTGDIISVDTATGTYRERKK